ncbi:putative toxin-antitoxin system toxin component, PIN family [Pseudanabaena sp. UWO311]|uniref:putative toxin-antitoxin system toxin component, PIN family n=1 Tax=Pseudanabaena sp. UWO311 TaxID=2487337 RepID=UPI00115A146E|nr:putative toxin-antitoxin system toxin component, PIN family [Pseudanabaena sp. UWO311]TYQ23719.1 putative toxin-antitoxin system toxin component, PIN family [Pseudanabaena sp. UWO311]
MRLVLDTNVLISAILSPNSISAKILNWGEDNGVILYSAATLNEVLSVLGSSKFSKYIDHNDIDGLSICIKTVWLFVEILNQVQLCRDPKDDKFIDLALNGDASHLITGDSDLLVLNPVENTSIINPRTFWDEIIKL